MDDDESWILAARADAGPCPRCGGGTALPILYGMPMQDDYERLSGRVVFAGCIVPEEPARFACSRCGQEWGRRSTT